MIDFTVNLKDAQISGEELRSTEKKFTEKHRTHKLVGEGTNSDKKFYAIGDLIQNSCSVEFFKTFKIPAFKELNGIFYLLIFDYTANSLFVFSSLFSLLPVYYYKSNGTIIVSSDPGEIKSLVPNLTVNKQFILQQTLFNYSLFNETIHKEIHLLPSNSYIEISEKGVRIIQHTKIEELFTGHPVSWKKAADSLADIFIDQAKIYFPKEPFDVSFTGGFDSRTLVACATNLELDFSTFSFGSHTCDDINIPQQTSRSLNIPYTPFYLDNQLYINELFFKNGNGLIQNSFCNSNLLYVHFYYAASECSRKVKYLLTGYCGSELLRAMHITGAMISSELVSFFSLEENEWINRIRNSLKLNILIKDSFQSELDQLVELLIEYKRSTNFKLLTKQQIFYTFVFEEIFRKFFGSIIAGQFNFINVRVPYLNYIFISQLLQTSLAGINNPFFTDNPLIRFRGQYLYAKIIEKTFPRLLKYKTGKGYKPQDLLSPFGNANILLPYIAKRISRNIKPPFIDNLSIVSGLKSNRNNLQNHIHDSGYYNHTILQRVFEDLDTASETERDLLAIAASTSLYLSNEKG